MTQYTLKNTCMIVMILLSAIALSPTWAGGEHHQAKIKIIGNDFELDETDISDLDVGDSTSFYTDEGREILISRQEDGFDISVDGEAIDIPHIGVGAHGERHGMRVITKEIICDSDEDCDHDFISVHDETDMKIVHIAGDDLDLDIEMLHELECDDEEECNHAIQIFQDSSDWDIDLADGEVLNFTQEDGNKVIIIKKHFHSDEGEEI